MPTSTEFTERYNQLNPEQKKAVDTIEGPVMVLSGPGTGKTQTLAMRIANILAQTQMDPWNILCLTFTESGVAAMRSRLLSIIGTASYYVRIHTFHSFCNDIISDHIELFAKAKTWQLVSDAERIGLFRSIIDTLPAKSPLKPFFSPYMFFRDIMGNISDLKQEDISPDDFAEIVSSLDRFLQKLSDPFQVFFAYTPKERTDEACNELEAFTMQASKEAKLSESLQMFIAHMFDQYHELVGGSDSVREQSKARTVLKNTLKKWFEKESGALAKQKEMILVYREYEKSLAEMGRYDYEDMISMVVRELRVNSDLLATLQEQFQFILVDEYQDTNGAQNEIVTLLGSFDDSPNIFVVGDDKQSIYRFQGASLANMLSFYEKYKRAVQIISLTKNYRSHQYILDAADAVIANNKESLAAHIPGVHQNLVAQKSVTPEKISVLTSSSEDEESYSIAKHIEGLLDKGVPPHHIAVLYRYNKDGEYLYDTLRRVGVPARIEMGEDIFESVVVQQFIALLEWIAYGRSEEQLARVLSYSWWNIDEVDTLKTIHFAGKHRIPMYEVMTNADYLHKAGVRENEKILALGKRLALWRKQAASLPIMEFLEQVLVESRFYADISHLPNSIEILRSVKTFLGEAKKVSRGNVSFGLTDFVKHLSFMKEHDIGVLTPEWEGGGGAVRLMTAHKAKGLEFPYVIIARLNDKHWGGGRDRSHVPLPEGLVRYDFIIASDNNEDERRLFYVAITRAMQGLLITRSSHSSTGKETVPSLFLSEIPDQVLNKMVYEESPDDQLARLSKTLTDPIIPKTSDAGRAYIASLLETYSMSVTHLNNYLECRRKFYFRNILQIPSIKSRSLSLGSAVHGTLRDVFEYAKERGELPASTWIFDVYGKYVQREALSETDKKDVLEQGIAALTGYIAHYGDAFITPGMTEYSFRKHGVHVLGVPITGNVDKIEIINTDEKIVNVVDYKTGNSDTWREKMRKDGNYVRQLIFYKLLCDNAPDFPYTMESGEIDFIEPSKGGYIKKRIAIQEEDVKLLSGEIVRVWQEIQELVFLDPDAGCRKDTCEYCRGY